MKVATFRAYFQTISLPVWLLIPCMATAQVFEAHMPETEADRSYSDIEFMSAAESVSLTSTSNAEDRPASQPQAETLRLVVYRSEIYQSIVIETITTGLEGCCSKVAHARVFGLPAFAENFGFKGEVSGFKFDRWVSPRSFLFTYKEYSFVATVVDGNQVRVVREADANLESKSNRATPSTAATAPTAVNSIPDQFLGRWGSGKIGCATDADDSYLVVNPNHVTFWESDGPVESIVVRSQYEIEFTAKLSGEGETWISKEHFRLSRNGDDLTWVNPSGADFVRHRCPNQKIE